MKTFFITVLVFIATGFNLRVRYDSGAMPPNHTRLNSFPIGKYTSCAQGAHNSGENFSNASGFQDGAVLTLAQRGTTVTSTYIDQNGVTQSLNFSIRAGSTATLAQKGQVINGFTAICVLMPGREQAHPAIMTVNTGTLTYNAGTVFLNVTGSVQSNAGTCGRSWQPGSSFWVLCENREGGALPSIRARSPAVMKFAGHYSCSTQIDTLYRIKGLEHHVAGGASGTLTLTGNGSKVTSRYSGDRSLAGTLHFNATGSMAAIAARGQRLMAPCMAPIGTSLESQTPEPLPVTAAAITLTGSTLFLSFAGTMAAGSSCPGANVAGSLICSR